MNKFNFLKDYNKYRVDIFSIHIQVHFTIAVQFYVYVNVESYVHAFLQN